MAADNIEASLQPGLILRMSPADFASHLRALVEALPPINVSQLWPRSRANCNPMCTATPSRPFSFPYGFPWLYPICLSSLRMYSATRSHVACGKLVGDSCVEYPGAGIGLRTGGKPLEGLKASGASLIIYLYQMSVRWLWPFLWAEKPEGPPETRQWTISWRLLQMGVARCSDSS